MADRTLILSIVVAYLAACIAIGIWASRRTHSAEDFFVAGKRMGIWVLGFAIFSTTLSGFGFIGGPGLVYKYGTSSFWICVPVGFGAALSYLLIGKRLRVFAEMFDVLTLPDAIELRYNSKLCRLISAVVILFGIVGYLGTQILAFGMIAESFFEMDRVAGVLVGVSVIVIYAVTGGIIASLYTDLMQGSLMVFASLAVFYLALAAVGEGDFAQGPARITEAMLDSGSADAVGPFGTLGPMLCLSWFFIFAIGNAGQPHIITKMFMIRDLRGIRWVALIGFVAYSLSMLLWISVGFAMKHLEPDLANADFAAPTFLLHHTPAWLAGIVFAGLCSAIMSTADAFLNLGAAVFVHDIPKAIIGRPVKRELLWARIATGVLAAAATAFALSAGDLVAVIGIFSWGTFAAALVPVVAIGFNWKRATWQAAAAAMLTGLSLHFALELLKRYPTREDPTYTLPYGVDTGAVALMVSLSVFIITSFLSKPAQISHRVQQAIDL